MAIIEDRLSTSIVEDTIISPDERERVLDEDYEYGPTEVGDPSDGLFSRIWKLTWDNGTGDFTVTGEGGGTPVVVTNAAGVTQCSLAFDQNGRASIAYVVGDSDGYLYWFDTTQAMYVTTNFAFPVYGIMACLDDKRYTQQQANDILLFYTIADGLGGYNLRHRRQRDRFTIEKSGRDGVYRYIYKLGMHQGLRLQMEMRTA